MVETNISKSKLFQDVLIAKSGEVKLSKEQTKDNSRILFLASKASNSMTIKLHCNWIKPVGDE